MTNRSIPGIKRVLDGVKKAADARGVVFDRQLEDATRQLVNARVEASAEALGVTTQGWMASYSDLVNPEEILDLMLEAKAIREKEMSGPSVTLDMHDLGRVIGSLGQAARMVSLNFDEPGRGLDHDAQAVLDGAGDGITAIGAAISSMSETGHVVLPGNAVGLARQALRIVIEKFKAGEWSAQNDRITAIIPAGMGRDLALLDPKVKAGQDS